MRYKKKKREKKSKGQKVQGERLMGRRRWRGHTGEAAENTVIF